MSRAVIQTPPPVARLESGLMRLVGVQHRVSLNCVDATTALANSANPANPDVDRNADRFQYVDSAAQ